MIPHRSPEEYLVSRPDGRAVASPPSSRAAPLLIRNTNDVTVTFMKKSAGSSLKFMEGDFTKVAPAH